MKDEVEYTEGEIGEYKIVKDFLPPPHELVRKEETSKITLALNKSSIDFFKDQSEQLNVPYQRMIRALLDKYVDEHTRHS